MPGPWQIAIIAVVALVIFGGRGKIPALMKDLGKGITSFKKGLKDEDSSDEALEDNSSESDISISSPKSKDTSN